ncbi:hypothetical protein [Rhodanobacter ginsengiterrae]|uniref:hypothetical protein n=1 Tax=Rhodanobacter ginsengiterrae TaxID=2008451 RepID=UPI003CF5CDF8
MVESQHQHEVLAHAQELMQHGNHVEAIAYLRRACLEQPLGEYQRLLAQCRYLAYLAQPPVSAVKAAWPPEVNDVFADVEGVPEIAADRLDSLTLAAGIRHHGALLVRGLLHDSQAARLVAGIDEALRACEAWRRDDGQAIDPGWYSRLPLVEGCALAEGRDFGESIGGVWAADSPRMLYELTEMYEANGVSDTIAGYFGERPMLSVGKSTLRRVPASQGVADWHQDGSFMGSEIRSVNVWLSLSHCGEDASGLEFLPRRVPAVLPTGSHGANFYWTVGPGMVEQTAAGVATVSPVFAPGDALLFDHFFLHRTGVPPRISKPRYAIESWFFAPSAYPEKQVPLWL